MVDNNIGVNTPVASTANSVSVEKAPVENSAEPRVIKHRNLFLVYIFGFITFGIYFLYWAVSTKNDINSRGGNIPTAWLLIIPIANLYWIYRYCEGFSENIRKDDHTLMWFVVYILAGIIMPAIVQHELNKL